MLNTYRQWQLHVADLICRINHVLAGNGKEPGRKTECRPLRTEIQDQIDEICASIPFMLAGDAITTCKPEGASWSLPRPPMLLGGLSMQWRLFTIAILENAPTANKDHARDVLLWLGETLGLGQAKVLACV